MNLQISYYVWAPDSKAGDVAQKRQAVLNAHTEWLQARRADGSVGKSSIPFTFPVQSS